MIRLKGWMLSRALRLQRWTWRVQIDGREHLTRLYAGDKRFLFCFWHGKYVPLFSVLEGCRACVITNQSQRGKVIAEISRNFGYQSAQIPDHLRRGSFRLMEDSLSSARAGAVAVDGPLGPRHRVKSGVIRIASASGFDLLPVSVDSRRKMVSKKRWDRMEIPLLFTKVCLVIGEPITVPPDLRFRQVRNLIDNLAESIAKLDKKAENMVRQNETEKE